MIMINSTLNKLINKYLTLVLSIIVALIWIISEYTINLESLTFFILSISSILVFFYAKDGFPFLPIITLALLVPNNGSMKFDNVPISLVMFTIILILSMVLFIIVNKINLFIGKLKWSMVILTVVLILVSLRFNLEIPLFIYSFLLILPVYLFYYLFVSSSIKGDKRIELIELFIAIGLVISVQSIVYCLNTPFHEIVENIKKGVSYSISWSHSNIGAIVLNMTIGLTLSAIILKPHNIFYQLSLIPQIFSLLITASRGGIFVLFFMIFFFLILMYKYRPSNKYFMQRITLLVVSIIIVYLLIPNIINSLINFFLSSLSGSDPLTGRIKLYEDALKQFNSNPLFGTGIFGAVDVFKNNINGVIHYSYGFKSYHSMILQILACSGLVGLLAVIFNYYEITRLLINKIDKFKLSIMIVLIGVTLYGLFDNVYMMIHYTLLAYPIFGIIEAFDRQTSNTQVYN